MTRHVFLDLNDNVLGSFLSKEQVKGNQDYFKIKYNSATSFIGMLKSLLTNKQYHRDHLKTLEVENKGIEGQYDVITLALDKSKPNILDQLNRADIVRNESLIAEVKSLKLENSNLRIQLEEQRTSTSSAVASMRKTVDSRRQSSNNNSPFMGLNGSRNYDVNLN